MGLEEGEAGTSRLLSNERSGSGHMTRQGKPSDSAFERTVLPNGVRIVTERIPSVRSVSVGAWVLTGSRDEDPQQNGISHFVEHMVFKGTETRRMHHIAQRMESVGGYLNAYTSKEYTCYYARSLDEHLGRAIDILCDLVLHPVFPEKELEKEKGVVLEEIKMYDDMPEDAIFDDFEALIYGGHALGRPILGTADTVGSFTRQGLVDFIERAYVPPSVLFAICGNVDHQRAVRAIERAFSAVQRPGGRTDRSPVNGYAAASASRARPIQQGHFVMGTRAVQARDARRAALTVLNTVLGGGMSSRLNQNIRERYGFCYSIYSFVNFLSDTGDFGVYLGVEPSRLAKAEKLVMKELQRLVEEPVRERTLSQAKNQLKGALMLGLEDLSNRMMRLGRMELYYEAYFTLDQSLNSIDRVKPEDVQSIAAELFKPDLFSTAIIVPDHRNQPAP